MSSKYVEFDSKPGSTHNRVVDLVPEGARVLEFGCATGYMSEVLRARRGCHVTGVEISAEAADVAKTRCDRVLVGDAEELDYDALLGKERFDVALFADVLEHLRDPERLLRRVRKFLSRRGVVVASVPNVAHGSVRLALLAGEFRYRETGLLDDSHLRFFTHDTLLDLFEAAGYLITHLVRQHLSITEGEIQIPSLPMSAELQIWLGHDSDADTYQFIVRALPSTAVNKLSDYRRQVNHLRMELETAEQELLAAKETADTLKTAYEERGAELDAARTAAHEQGAQIHALEANIRELADQEIELRTLLLDAHDQLLRRDEELAKSLEERARNEHDIVKLKKEVAERDSYIETLGHEIHWMQSTRVWQVGTSWWKLKSNLHRGKT
jgi:O-antigen biosynthesis protein